MNAAAKYINQSNFFHGQFLSIRLSATSTLHMLLIVAVLISSLTVIYVTNMHRLTCSQLGSAEQRAHQLQLKWGKLLLEQASLESPSRVERIARAKLDMHLPENKNIMVLRTQ